MSRLDQDKYARMLLRSTFCLAPVGDRGTPGARLFEAIGAGCVPLIVGLSDDAELPLAKQIAYSRFAGFLSRSAFAKDPVYALSALVHRLTPRLPAMRQALADARHRLAHGEQGGVTTLMIRAVAAAAPAG